MRFMAQTLGKHKTNHFGIKIIFGNVVRSRGLKTRDKVKMFVGFVVKELYYTTQK